MNSYFNEDNQVEQWYSSRLPQESDSNERKIIDVCSWCGMPIFEDDAFFYDEGSLYFCFDCLREGCRNISLKNKVKK